MQLEEGIADPAMKNADGVLVEAQGHGYVLGLQHDIGGGVVPLTVGYLVGFGLVAQLGCSRVGHGRLVSGLDFASAMSM
jgi:hypothetical protein